MKPVRFALLIAACSAAAACGQRADLKPAPGHALPVKPLLAKATPTAEQLLTPPVNARPERVDELIKRSEPRRADRFDLPPPDGGAAPVLPETEEPTSTETTGVSDPE
jgi:hypothetical protein